MRGLQLPGSPLDVQSWLASTSHSVLLSANFLINRECRELKNMLSWQLMDLMTEHWRSSNFQNIYIAQYATIGNHQPKNANTPKCQISSNSCWSRGANWEQFTIFLLVAGRGQCRGVGLTGLSYWLFIALFASYLPSFRLVVPIIAGRTFPCLMSGDFYVYCE